MHVSFNKQIADEAAEWAVTIDSAPLNDEEQAALLTWLRQSPVHLDEFLLALGLFEGLSASASARSIDVEALLDEVSANVITLPSPPVRPAADNDGTAGFRRRYRISALGLCLVLVVGSLLFTTLPGGPAPRETKVVTTALGEQRSITLEDGTLVFVNTQTRIAWQYTDSERRLQVYFGEALFDVRSDPTRPFRVFAGETVAEAIGTRFNVRFIDRRTEVSVIEGMVAFEHASLPLSEPQRSELSNEPGTLQQVGDFSDGRVILAAGESAGLRPDSTAPIVATTEVDAVSAWTSRKLVFKDQTLEEIAAEFNRYNRQEIVVRNDSLGRELISGVFAADDPESLIDFLVLTRGVRVYKSRHRYLLLETGQAGNAFPTD